MSTVLTSYILLFLAAILSVGAAGEGEDNIDALSGVPVILYKALSDCVTLNGGKETVLCVRQRLSRLVDDLSDAKELSIVPDYVTLVKEEKLLSGHGNIEDSAKMTKKSRSLVDTVSSVFTNRRIQLRLPSFSTLIQSEGRKKNDKGYAVVGMMMAGSMLAMGMAALSALAGKALAISMAALMMAAMAAMKKGNDGGGGGGHHHSSYEVVSVPVHGHHHRSLIHHIEPPIVEPSVKPFAYTDNFPAEP